MTWSTVEQLKIQSKDKVLEIGPGLASHLDRILGIAENIKYYGLDISPLMIEEAIRINQIHVNHHRAFFQWYSGENIPYDNHYFHKIFTVNTLYFWKEPQVFLEEIYRVLKPLGSLIITFVQASTLEKLPFTKYGFKKYDDSSIEDLSSQSKFKTISLDSHTEIIKSKLGEEMKRDFYIWHLQKPKE
nr:class I SAM-dependent methyltransferase [Membranihabitans marinus]